MIGRLARRLRHTGFIGPYYDGVLGRARFLAESVLARREIILAVTPVTFIEPDVASSDELQLHWITKFEDLVRFKEQFEQAYYPGFINRWKAPLTWGEQAVVGTIEGKVACYNWMQRGTPAGFPTYYGRLFDDEARVLRAGVLPTFRGRGVNRLMKRHLLNGLFADRVRRVYVECYARNVPSIRSLMGVGFSPIALITVIELPPLRRFVRWHSQGELEAALRRCDLSVSPA